MTGAEILKNLPPYTGTEILISPDQEVKDIVQEICDAHGYFGPDYDGIAAFFYTGNTYETCQELFDFCKNNIQYKIESATNQTTKSPAAILTQGHGDCKGYAGFIAGCLDAMNRNYGAGIKWRYRFASYDMFNQSPQHVFVVAKDNDGDIWIDPVLNSFDDRSKEPVYTIDKKVSAMSLKRVSGVPGVVGTTDLYAVFTDIKDFISQFGDQVPNYPIKSGATYEKLLGIVNSKVPLPPRDLDHAKQLLQTAIYEKQLEQQGDGGNANKTIIMMYDERIAALQNSIAAAGGSTGSGGLFPTPGSGQLTAGMSTTTLLLLGGAAVFMLSRRGKKVSGTPKKDKTILFLGLGGLALYLYMKNKKEGTDELPIKAAELNDPSGTQVLPMEIAPGEPYIKQEPTQDILYPADVRNWDKTTSGGGVGPLDFISQMEQYQ